MPIGVKLLCNTLNETAIILLICNKAGMELTIIEVEGMIVGVSDLDISQDTFMESAFNTPVLWCSSFGVENSLD